MFMNRAELPIPPAAKRDREAVERLRVWFAHGRPQVSLANGVWDGPEPWGMLLAELAEHVADTYVDMGGHDKAEVLHEYGRVWRRSGEQRQASGRLFCLS